MAMAQYGGDTHGLKLEVAKLKDENDCSGGEVVRDGLLHPGQEMEFRLKNEGTEDLWVTAVYLDANLGIKRYYSGSIERGKAVRPFRTTTTVKGNSWGQEGMFVFATPRSLQKEEPNFGLLEQQPLQVVEARKRGPKEVPNTPFAMLMSAGAFNRLGQERLTGRPPTTAVVVQSWRLLPGQER